MKVFKRKIIAALIMVALLFQTVGGFMTGITVKAATTDVSINVNMIYKIVNASTGKVIDIPNGENKNNLELQTYSDNGTAAQQFKFVKSVDNGYYHIIPMCAQVRAIDNTNESKSAGNTYQIYQQNGWGAQEFAITNAGNGYVRIINRQSNMALQDEGKVKQENISDNQAQLWKLVEVRQTNCITNPIRYDGADPWVVKAGNAYYYCYSGGGIYIGKCYNLEDLGNAKITKVVNDPYEGNGVRINNYWAPELIYVRGHWYIYCAPEENNGGNDSHRMYVFEGGTNENNPLDGAYNYKGKLQSPTSKWAIDGTVFEYSGELYTVWSGWEGDSNGCQKLYIARMSNPYTISSERVCIATPVYGWETNTNPTVNEGPEVLMKNGKVHIIYSASGSWTDTYCLARITCENGNFMDPNSWTKASEPVFQQTDNLHGIGHASFVKSNDETEDWIVYHAAKRAGAGWDRDIHIQSFTWKGDVPFFGIPVDNGVEIAKPSKDGNNKVDQDAYYTIKNVATGRVMDIPNGDDANSKQLQTWDSNKSDAQQFKFAKKSPGWYTISPKCAPTRGIDNPEGKTTIGLRYQTWSLNDNVAQNFKLEEVADGTFRIINQASLLALTDEGQNDGYAVKQEKLTNNDNQKWTLEKVVPEKVYEGKIELNGYQMSATYNNIEGNIGLRTIYSVDDKVNGKDVTEKGLIYGIVYGNNPITENDLVLGNTNKHIKSVASTNEGKTYASYGSSDTMTSYARTMSFIDMSKEGYTCKYFTRAYAKLNDGSVVYTDVKSFNVFDVANTIYTEKKMPNAKQHNYLFEKVLNYVDPEYGRINY